MRMYYSQGFLLKEQPRNNSAIYRAILKYGHSNFRLEILEYCDLSCLLQREQYYLDLLKPEYNICKKAESTLGRLTLDTTRRKLRLARLVREYKRQKLQGETLFEFELRRVVQRIEELESGILRLRSIFERFKLELNTKSKVSSQTRKKMLASSQTAQAIEVTDLETGLVSIYPSGRNAALALNMSRNTLLIRLKMEHMKPYKGRYLIKASTSDRNNAR